MDMLLEILRGRANSMVASASSSSSKKGAAGQDKGRAMGKQRVR
jgi:hypothetical protein